MLKMNIFIWFYISLKLQNRRQENIKQILFALQLKKCWNLSQQLMFHDAWLVPFHNLIIMIECQLTGFTVTSGRRRGWRVWQSRPWTPRSPPRCEGRRSAAPCRPPSPRCRPRCEPASDGRVSVASREPAASVTASLLLQLPESLA